MIFTTEKRPLTLLFNPFFYIAGSKALFIGIVAILFAGFLGWLSHTHFDGVLDTHTNAQFAAPIWFFLLEGLINWLALALVLLLMGRICSNTPFRALDLIGTQALARWPTILFALFCLMPGYQRFSEYLVKQITAGNLKIDFHSVDAAAYMTVILAMLLFISWTVFLFYKSYSVSCNLKGGKAVGTFIAGLLLSEFVSKTAFALLVKTI